MSTGPAGAGGGPLVAVLAAFEDGAGSLAEVATRSHLPIDTVRASVDHLVRMGRLEAKELAIGCPSAGCGSCASGSEDGSAGCGSSSPSGRRSGPVLVTLSLVRR